MSVEQYLPHIKGVGRQRSHTALGLAGLGGNKTLLDRSVSAEPADRPGGNSISTYNASSISGNLSRDDLLSTAPAGKNKSTRNVRMHAKNVREWIRYFYEEADVRTPCP